MDCAADFRACNPMLDAPSGPLPQVLLRPEAAVAGVSLPVRQPD